MRLLIRVVINAIALAVTAYVLPGVHINGDLLPTLAILGIIFGLVNALLKPLVSLLSLPFTILTLGLFVLVINGFMLLVTAALSGGRLAIDGLFTAIVGAIVMSLVSMVLEGLLGTRRRN